MNIEGYLNDEEKSASNMPDFTTEKKSDIKIKKTTNLYRLDHFQ